MQTSYPNSPEVKISWFLGTGPLEYYYTLWSKTLVVGVGCYYSYRQNLAHDYNEAIVKATEKTGQTTWESFDISDYKRTNAASPDLSKNPDEVFMTFGKHQGVSVGQLMDDNVGYLWFLAAKSDWEPTQAKHARVLNYIRAMFRQEAVEVETKRQERIAAERAARDAARQDLPAFEGRVTISGTVISTKFVDNNFGGCLRMLVEHKDGWRVWGAVPSSIQAINETRNGKDIGQRGLERGDVVTFDATVQKSDKDPKFGFFNRPTKARLLRAHNGVIEQGAFPIVEVDQPDSAPASAGARANDDYGHVGGNYDA